VAHPYDKDRRSDRYPFIATAYVTDERTGSGITARLGDLSRHGCYIHMTTPFPAGTNISIHIGAGSSVFRAIGRVIHSHVNHGFGVEFDSEQIDPSSVAVLDAWLEEARALNTSEQA
jgi:PilZ domain